MNDNLKPELEKIQLEIREASSELATAANEYEKRRTAAQIKLSHASVRLAALVSLMKQHSA